MPRGTLPRVNWRMHPRPTPGPEEPAPLIEEPLIFQGLRHGRDSVWFARLRGMSEKVAPWASQEPAAYEDGMNAYQFQAANRIHAVNPLGT